MIFCILCFICCLLCSITNYIILKKVKSFVDLFDTLKYSFTPDTSFYGNDYMKVDDIE